MILTLGVLWTPGSVLSVVMFRSRGQEKHQTGEGCPNLRLFTSDDPQGNPHSNKDEHDYAGGGKQV